MSDHIEFYSHSSGQMLAHAETSHAPDRGDQVNIRKKTWVVIGRSFTLDYADDSRSRSVICVINLSEPPKLTKNEDAFKAVERALLGQRWTAEQARDLITLVEIGSA